MLINEKGSLLLVFYPLLLFLLLFRSSSFHSEPYLALRLPASRPFSFTRSWREGTKPASQGHINQALQTASLFLPSRSPFRAQILGMQRKRMYISKQQRHLCLLLSEDSSTSYAFVPADLVNKKFSEQRKEGQPGWNGAGRKAAQVSQAAT